MTICINLHGHYQKQDTYKHTKYNGKCRPSLTQDLTDTEQLHELHISELHILARSGLLFIFQQDKHRTRQALTDNQARHDQTYDWRNHNTIYDCIWQYLHRYIRQRIIIICILHLIPHANPCVSKCCSNRTSD